MVRKVHHGLEPYYELRMLLFEENVTVPRQGESTGMNY
jgi:hypothetical protein